MAKRFLSLSASDIASFKSVELTDLPTGPANSVLVTDPDGTQTEWSDKLEIETLKVNGDTGIDGELIVFGDAGTTGQVLKKTATGPDWQDITVADLNAGVEGQVLTSASGSAVWQDLPTFTLDDVPVGTEGQVLTTVSGSAAWQTPPPVDTNDIEPGAARQVLQTNAAGDEVEWTDEVDLTSVEADTLNVTGNLQLAGVSGTTGQFMKKTGTATQQWSNLSLADVPGGTTNQVLVTNSSSNAAWSSGLNVTTLTTAGANTLGGTTSLTGNLRFGTTSGTTGQFIKKTGASTQQWSNFALTDVPGGTTNQILTTASTGAPEWSSSASVTTLTASSTTTLNGNLRFNNTSGVSGQFLKKTSGTAQGWNNIVAADVAPGLAHATLQTNSAGTANAMTVEPNFPLISIGGTPFDYRSTSGSSPLYLKRVNSAGGTMLYSLSKSIASRYLRTGILVFAVFDGFSLNSTDLNGGDAVAYPYKEINITTGTYGAPNTPPISSIYIPVKLNGTEKLVRVRTDIVGRVNITGSAIFSSPAESSIPGSTTSMEVPPFSMCWYVNP